MPYRARAALQSGQAAVCHALCSLTAVEPGRTQVAGKGIVQQAASSVTDFVTVKHSPDQRVGPRKSRP